MHIGLVDLLWEGHHTPYVTLLSQYFTEQGHDVTFITDARNERLDEIPDLDRLQIEVRDVPQTPPKWTGFRTAVRGQVARTRQLDVLLEATRAADVDVVHFLFFDRTQIPFRAATWRTHPNTPVVATLHRDAFLSPSEGNFGKRATQLATTLALDSSLASGDLTALTVHADSIRDRIIGGVDAATRANTRTVPAPTPDYDVDATTAELRERLDLPRDEDMLLFFGGLREEKGPELLAEYVRGLDRPLAVVYAGSPVDFTEGEVEAWARRVEDPVEIVARLEYIPEEDVNAYFAAADALVLPYRRTRGISGPLRRAAAVGTPAVGRAASDVGDLIDHYDLGATFELDDADGFERALSTVLDGETDTEALATFAASRRWTVSGEAFLDVYRDALAGRERDALS